MSDIYSIQKATSFGEEFAKFSQQKDDTYGKNYQQYGLIQPEVNPLIFREISKISSSIPVCTRVYMENIARYGVKMEYVEGYGDTDAEAVKEWEKLARWMKVANPDGSIENLVAELVADYLDYGNIFLEYVDGEYPTIYRMSPDYMRVGMKKMENSEMEIFENGQVTKIPTKKYFRKYAQQIVDFTGGIVEFRQFGSMENVEKNEVIHVKNGRENEAYGYPVWYSVLPTIFGERSAHEYNYLYFANGRFSSMIVSVENGSLSEESKKTLRDSRGVKTTGDFVVLTVDGAKINDDGEKAEAKINFQKMVDIQNDDALFLRYMEMAKDEILSMYRLPRIFVGMSKDFNRATANAAIQNTEQYVFVPFRKMIMDEVFNSKILPRMGIHRVKLNLRNPEIINEDMLEVLLEKGIEIGAFTLGEILPIFEKFLNLSLGNIESVDEEFRIEYEKMLNTPVGTYESIVTQNKLEGQSDSQALFLKNAKKILRELRKNKQKSLDKSKYVEMEDDCYL